MLLVFKERSLQQGGAHAAPQSHILGVQGLQGPLCSPSFIHCMQLRFERWRGSLQRGGGTCQGSARAPLGGRGAPLQPFGTTNKERKYLILPKRGG